MIKGLPCQIEHRTATRHNTSRWAGGSTTELAIWPHGAAYADRDFTVRVSSAAVEDERSEFTPLPGYTRYIMPLDGCITLSHENHGQISLKPFEAHEFDGAWHTVSSGRCRDFNLMVRYGMNGGISPLSGGDETNFQPGTMSWLYCVMPCSLSFPAYDFKCLLQTGDVLALNSFTESVSMNIYASASDGGVCAVAALVREMGN